MSFEENNYSIIYKYIDWITNTEVAEINGKEMVCLHTEFGLLTPMLVAMEAMVRKIALDKNSVGFEIKTDARNKRIVAPKTKSATLDYFYKINSFLINYANSESHVLSPHLQAISDALEAVSLDPYLFRFRDPGSRDIATGKMHAEIFNEMVEKMAEIVTSTTFKERLRVRKRNAERNEAKGLAIEQKVFESKSRQLVLMLNFGYQEQHRAKITLEECQKHRKKFFNNCRSNKLLRGIVDYIWKLEEGDKSGLHLHMLIFYTADSCHDVYIAKQIGEYWVKVTEGKGQYWNSNANKAFHEKYGHGVGTGEINWNDEAKREALRTNIRYMTKADQFLRLKYSKHCHLFGTSEVAEKKKSGRPRSMLPKLDAGAAGKTLDDFLYATSLDETTPDEE
jgi:hypothetical protein